MFINVMNDEQILEGIIGGLGFIIWSIYWKNRVQYSIQVEAFFAWMFVWYTRKIGMNFYKYLKKINYKFIV